MVLFDSGNICCGQHWSYFTGVITVVDSTGGIVQG